MQRVPHLKQEARGRDKTQLNEVIHIREAPAPIEVDTTLAAWRSHRSVGRSPSVSWSGESIRSQDESNDGSER